MSTQSRKASFQIEKNVRDGQQADQLLEFELNPLVSEITTWNDADLVQDRTEFKALPKPFRVARICELLFSHGVAFVDYQPTAVWKPFPEIEKQSGGSSIVAPAKYTLNLDLSVGKLGGEFERAVKRLLRSQLSFTVTKSVAAFRAYNYGLTALDGVDAVGMLRWRPAAFGLLH
jgi:hypothetical protein